MDRNEAAAALDGNEYAQEGSKALWASMKEAGLVAVFGASDDLMEMRGAVYDERGCYGGGRALFDDKGLLPSRDDIRDDEELECYFARKKTAMAVKALWCVDDVYSWTYETDIPHATFDIVEDGSPYCRGIVFALADALQDPHP